MVSKRRRERHKLIMFHKVVNKNNCPSYILDLLPPLISSINRYHHRRPRERAIPRYRTKHLNKSFIPSTTRLWNSMPEDVQAISSLSQFERFISTSSTIVPKHYYYDARNEEVIHCRLRMEMSNLKHDLYNRHLTDNPICNCGNSDETAEHYFLSCPLYANIRATTIFLLPPHLIDIDTLLKGHPALSFEENVAIFEIVHNYIEETSRF